MYPPALTKRLFCLLMALATAIVLPSPVAFSQEMSLEEAMTALADFEFGKSRAPLQHISEAVRAAAAEHPEIEHTASELEALLSDMLAADISLEAKRFICRMLGEIGASRSVEALAAQLTDEALFHTALAALEQHPGSDAAAAMVQALAEASEDARLAIVEALGRQGHPDAIEPLTGLLQDEQDAMRIAAANALAAIQEPESCRVLLSEIADADDVQRLLLADAFLRCADVLCETAPTAVEGVLEQLWTEDAPTHVRIAAVGALMQCRPDRAPNLLLEALQDPCPIYSREALMLARRTTPDDTLIGVLSALLDTAPDERKPALIDVFAEVAGPSVTTSSFPPLLKSETPAVRRAALNALSVLGGGTKVGLLLEHATTGPADEQRIAREVLTRMPGTGTDARLLEIARDQRAEEAHRLRAIIALAERRVEEASPTLLSLAAHAAPSVREEAVRALRTLASPEMLPDLLGLIVPRGLEPIREQLPMTLAQTAERIPEPEMRAQPIIDALDAATRREERILLLETLGLIGDEQAFEAVRSYPETTDIDVRRAMVAALVRFQSPAALGELRAILFTERNPEIRARAYSGYISALRNATELALHEVNPHVQTAYEQAKTVAAKRDLVAAVTQLPSLTTMQLVAELADGDEVSAEAVRALLRIAAALAGAYPEEAREHLEGIIAREDVPEPVIAEAREALAFMGRFEGYIMSWALAGPYYEPYVMAEALFEYSFPPEKDPDLGNWRILPTLPDAEPPYALELDRVLGGNERVAFLRTTIHAPEAQEAVLELGTNDGCRVWWNGTLIHSLNVGRALTPGEDTLPVTIESGENDLMIAVFQHGAAWGATARLVTPDGHPVPGLRYTPALPAI